MSDPSAPIGPDAPIAPVAPNTPAFPPSALQFDRAELKEASEGRQAPACAFCRTPLFSSYFDVNGRMACESCRFKIEEQFKKGPGMAGFLRAAGAGLAAAVAGSGIYYAVREITGYEIGLISILVGLMVGKAVRWGSRERGGWVYQTLAVFLTYMAIVSTYIPMMAKDFHNRQESKTATAGPPPPEAKEAAEESDTQLTFGETVLGVIGIFALAAVIPFLAGFENILGLVIIAFGLWQAWKLNKRPLIAILGPLEFGAAPPSAPVEA